MEPGVLTARKSASPTGSFDPDAFQLFLSTPPKLFDVLGLLTTAMCGVYGPDDYHVWVACSPAPLPSCSPPPHPLSSCDPSGVVKLQPQLR